MNRKRVRFIFWGYLLFLILMAVLPLNSASSTSLNNLYVVRVRLDYLLHAILFIPWAFLYIIAFRPATLNAKLLMIGSGLLMAFATEGIQYFLTYRAYNINDLLANWLGVLLSTIALLINDTHLWKKTTSKQ